jgi:hypothetical protein
LTALFKNSKLSLKNHKVSTGTRDAGVAGVPLPSNTPFSTSIWDTPEELLARTRKRNISIDFSKKKLQKPTMKIACENKEEKHITLR